MRTMFSSSSSSDFQELTEIGDMNIREEKKRDFDLDV